MARVAILIPSYNHGRYLEACLRSIQAQTFADWEIVLVDDGSTDGSVAFAQELAQTEPRLRVYENAQNLGTYGTEQRALELSDSEFVAVMNSDDLWAPAKLARQIAALSANPTAHAAYFLGWMVDDHGAELPGEDVHAHWPTAAVQDTLPYLLYENRILASGVLFRRAGLRFEASCRYSGDWVALLQAAAKGPLLCDDQRLVFWRQHDNNTYRRSVKQMQEEIRVREAIARDETRWLATAQDVDLVRLGLQRNAFNLSNLYLYFLDQSGFAHHLQEAVKFGLARKTAWKRLASATISLTRTRAYIWRLEEFVPESDAEAARNTIRAQPPLTI